MILFKSTCNIFNSLEYLQMDGIFLIHHETHLSTVGLISRVYYYVRPSPPYHVSVPFLFYHRRRHFHRPPQHLHCH